MSEQEYLRSVALGRAIDECCALLKCERSDLVRMATGLRRSVEMLRGDIPVDPDSLPKRYRKIFKRRGR